MPSLDTLLTILPLASVTFAIIYYAINVRNANKSRNAGLYMQLWNSFLNPQFIRDFNEVLYHHTWTDYQDYQRKYGVMNNLEASSKITGVLSLFESLGGLLQQNFLDLHVLEEQASAAFPQLWEKYYPIIKEDRKTLKTPKLWNDAEHLYNQLKKTKG